MAPAAPAAPAVLAFGFALWLGLYLLGRPGARPARRLAGLGLVAYALGLGAGQAGAAGAASGGGAAGDVLDRLQAVLLTLPAPLWTGALLALRPGGPGGPRADGPGWAAAGRMPGAAWLYLQLPAVVLLAAGGAPAAVVAACALLPLLLAVAALWRAARAAPEVGARRGLALIGTAVLFFALAAGLLLFPAGWLPRSLVVLSLGFDLLLLGGSIAVLDAFDEGEALLPDLGRSAAGAAVAAVLLGLPLGLTLRDAADGGRTLALLLVTAGTGIALQTLADPLQAAIDRVVFANAPALRRARAGLREVTSALPRVDPDLDLDRLEDDAFVRLTRQALSHYGDLPRLAGSPLARLPLVTRRLAQRGAADDALERAAELKAVLAESIARLKPRGAAPFGTSDEWRHYNALYFPYVAGLRPYSRRAPDGAAGPGPNGASAGPGADGLHPGSAAALAWLRSAVPERTLHHWQGAAARAVAGDLRERSRRPNGAPPPAA